MPITQTQIDELEAAIASGVTAVNGADGRHVRYGTIDEMLRALAWLKAEQAAQLGSASGSRTTLASVSRD